jgi:spore germination protein KC
MKRLIVVFLLVILCTGCWNYKELTELGIVSAMAISRNEDGKYVVDLQMVNILKSGDKGISESPISIMSGEGVTIADAIRSINMKSSKVFFSSNIEYVIIDKSVTNKTLEEVLDFLARDTKLSLNFLIVTSTKDKPSDVLAALSQFNLNPASNVSELIKRSEERYGASYSLTFKDYLAKYLDKGITPVYPNVHLVGESDEADKNEILEDSDSNDYVEIYNLVAFDKEGNPIELGLSESFGFNFLSNRIQSGTVTSQCGEEHFTVETLKSKVGFDKLDGNKVTVKGEIEAEVFFYGCDYDLNEANTLDKLSDITKDTITNYLKSAVNLSILSKTDFIGVGNWIYKNENSYFDFDKRDWESEGLPNLEFDYDIKVKLLKQGNLKGDI